jgi:hypothetical protein
MHWLSSLSDIEIPTIGQRLLDSGAMLDQYADSNVTHFSSFFQWFERWNPSTPQCGSWEQGCR